MRKVTHVHIRADLPGPLINIKMKLPTLLRANRQFPFSFHFLPFHFNRRSFKFFGVIEQPPGKAQGHETWGGGRVVRNRGCVHLHVTAQHEANCLLKSGVPLYGRNLVGAGHREMNLTS